MSAQSAASKRSLVGWGCVWAWVERPLEEVRQRFGIPPLAA